MFGKIETSRRNALGALAGAAISSLLPGCGTVLHPERRGQRAGDLDWRIVAFDTVGLMLFFVPGVVAFAVDFNNGTIYLPDEGYADARDRRSVDQLRTVAVPPDELDQPRIEREVSNHVGEEISLTSGEVDARPLAEIDEFWSAADDMAEKRPPAPDR